MQKVLIISYYFPPCNFIGANRPHSWAESFLNHGIYPTVVTRHWKGTENIWTDYHLDDTREVEIEKNSSFAVIRLPYRQKNAPLPRFMMSIKWISKLYHLYLNLSGEIHSEVNGRSCFSSFLSTHLETQKYDCILITSPPLNLVRLGHELSEQFKIPWVADFRDLWDNGLLNPSLKMPVRDRVLNFIIERHLKKWLRTASLCITVSKPLTEQLERVTNAPLLVVTNGYEKNLFNNLEKSDPGKFTVSLIGTLYPYQSIETLLNGIKKFLEDKNSEKVSVNFIGAAAIPEVKEMIENHLPGNFLRITGRIKRLEALSFTLNSHVLIQPAWPGYRGIYSTKLFEYLGSGNNILISPGDNDVIDEIIKITGAGRIGNSDSEVQGILEAWYREWEETGGLKYSGIKTEIQKYTRENQARQVAEYLLENIIK